MSFHFAPFSFIYQYFEKQIIFDNRKTLDYNLLSIMKIRRL